MSRTAAIERKTKETDITLSLSLDGSGQIEINTGVGFLDHMLTLFAKHGQYDLSVNAVGDTHVDDHHTVEDVGICLGQVLLKCLGDKAGLTRYGSISLPMEETFVTCGIDLGGRYWYESRVTFPTEKIGEFDTQLVDVFWQAVAANGLMNLHFVMHHGFNSHHISEAMFKSAARALRQAVTIDPRQQGVPSSKGTLTE